MALNSKFGTEDVSQYLVHSRREIVTLLRAVKDRNQLVSMNAGGGAEPVLTSILGVDEGNNIIVVDRAPTNLAHQRILDSQNVAFETRLDSIRILFSSPEVQECLVDDQPALYLPIPQSLVRLQRRENYRVATPVVTPVRCTITLPPENPDDAATTVVVAVKDISCGGIALIDEKMELDNTIGLNYEHCRIDIPGGSPLQVKLQVRNSIDLKLANGREQRKLGCMFVNLPGSTLAAVQRYITRLERERNAKATGLG